MKFVFNDSIIASITTENIDNNNINIVTSGMIFEKRIVTAGTYNTVDDILKALAKATNEADKIKTNLYKLENIDKPIKGLSSYKVSELIDICNKLSIETKNTDGKNKSKNDLYELIIQFF